MRFRSLLAVLILSSCSYASAENKLFYGDWKTTNRKLDGQMTCVVTEKGKGKWEGRFYGVWQGVDFDYTVPFTGPADNLHGRAIIDYATYEWSARLEKDRFRANFDGDRYRGSFDLKATTEANLASATKGIATKVVPRVNGLGTKERRKDERK